METLYKVLLLGSLMLMIIALVQRLSARTAFPEATLLALTGITLGSLTRPCRHCGLP